MWFTSLISLCLESLSHFVLREQPFFCSRQSLIRSVSLSVHLQLLSEFNLTALRQIWIYDLRNEARLSPCLAHCAPVAPKQPGQPFFPLQPLQLPPTPLSPALGSQLANNSSHSSNHNQCKATLKLFSVVNAVKALMGGLKSGSQIKYQLRIPLMAYIKWCRDDLIVLEMLFSFLAWAKNGYLAKAN